MGGTSPCKIIFYVIHTCWGKTATVEQHHRNRIETILKLLTPQQKKVVFYRHVDGLSLEEMYPYECQLSIRTKYAATGDEENKKTFFSEK